MTQSDVDVATASMPLQVSSLITQRRRRSDNLNAVTIFFATVITSNTRSLCSLVGSRKNLENFINFTRACEEHFSEVIFIAGNHDISLDPGFYERHKDRFHFTPKQQLPLNTVDWIVNQFG